MVIRQQDGGITYCIQRPDVFEIAFADTGLSLPAALMKLQKEYGLVQKITPSREGKRNVYIVEF